MSQQNSNSILVPAPTAWPFMLALGLTLICAGLVTHGVVSVAGACILLRASVGWWFDVLPQQKEESVAIAPEGAPRPAFRLGKQPAPASGRVAGKGGAGSSHTDRHVF